MEKVKWRRHTLGQRLSGPGSEESPFFTQGHKRTFGDSFPAGASGRGPSPANAGDVRDMGSIPGSGRSPGGGHGNPLQCSCLENPMDRGAWEAMVYRVAESDKTKVT